MSETKEVETKEQEQTQETEQQVEQTEQPAKPPWFMERINAETRRRSDAERQAATLSEQNRALRASMEALVAGRPAPKEGEGTERTYTQAEVEAEAQRRAEVLATTQLQQRAEVEFATSCNAIAAAGKAAYPDFDATLANLTATGVMNGQPGQRAFLEAIIELSNGHDVLHKLGQSPEQAIRLSGMRPMALALALGKLSDEVHAERTKEVKKPVTERQVSNAPPPVTRVAGSARATEPALDDTELPMAEFIRRRDAEAAEKRRH